MKKAKPKENKEKCFYCSGGEIELTSFESDEIEDDYIRLLFNPEDRTLSITDDMSSIMGHVDIGYCPFCRRKL